jgi:hypothetical protein
VGKSIGDPMANDKAKIAKWVGMVTLLLLIGVLIGFYTNAIIFSTQMVESVKQNTKDIVLLREVNIRQTELINLLSLSDATSNEWRVSVDKNLSEIRSILLEIQKGK